MKQTTTTNLMGALWVTGGAVTVGLSDVAHVLGRTGTRLYSYDGGYAFGIGVLLILSGAGLLLRGFLATKAKRQ